MVMALKRSFCYVDDLLEGMMRLMANESLIGPVNIETLVSSPSSNWLRKSLKTNSNSKIVFEDLPQDDPLQRKPDITLAREALNWERALRSRRDWIRPSNFQALQSLSVGIIV